MREILLVIGTFAALTATRAPAAEFQIPPFLPSYYVSAFRVGEQQLLPVKRAIDHGVEQATYATEDQSIALLLEKIDCDGSTCPAIFLNILRLMNDRVTASAGEFHLVSGREIHAELHAKARGEIVFVFALPTGILVWDFGVTSGDALRPDLAFKTIRRLVNRQRYQEARSLGNIAMGKWAAEMHEYARQLLQDGNTREGLAAVRDLLATSSFNYEAHVDFIENTGDREAARASAGIVFKNAESRKLIDSAAKALGQTPATLDSIPFLEKNETGLQVILIPLPPCNPWILDEAAKVYRQITDIPVKIRRLKEVWWFAAPDRIYRQRDIQRFLVGLRRERINFAGWNAARYASELLAAVESKDALSRYQANELVSNMNAFKGQYRAAPVLNWFSQRLERYRSGDRRTMYVGITEANIYSGDNNYIFSSAILEGTSPASVMSYSMILAETLGQAYQSRSRLVERIAKELVPASLKQLGIPRPLDPSDPYSYANGVMRLDQKTLVLSEQTKDALKRFREN
jgi:predicted Zn-dependent protease